MSMGLFSPRVRVVVGPPEMPGADSERAIRPYFAVSVPCALLPDPAALAEGIIAWSQPATAGSQLAALS
jgi:hypothetical protein